MAASSSSVPRRKPTRRTLTLPLAMPQSTAPSRQKWRLNNASEPALWDALTSSDGALDPPLTPRGNCHRHHDGSARIPQGLSGLGELLFSHLLLIEQRSPELLDGETKKVPSGRAAATDDGRASL